MDNEIDNFKAEIKIVGSSSLMIIIPSNIAKFADLKEGHHVKIWIRKETTE